MKIVIDLPEWFIEDTKEFNFPTPMDKAIINGQPLSDVLDKIRAEVEALEYLNIEDGSDGYDKYIEQYEVIKILDKYKAESEETDANSN